MAKRTKFVVKKDEQIFFLKNSLDYIIIDMKSLLKELNIPISHFNKDFVQLGLMSQQYAILENELENWKENTKEYLSLLYDVFNSDPLNLLEVNKVDVRYDKCVKRDNFREPRNDDTVSFKKEMSTGNTLIAKYYNRVLEKTVDKVFTSQWELYIGHLLGRSC